MSTSDFDYDVIVVGGGPAGVSVAYCLSKLGNSVIIIDKKPISQIGNKTCGDALDKSSPQLLFDEFDLPLPFGDEISANLDTLTVMTPSSKLSIDAPGYTVDRHIYGQRLLQNCIDNGVVVKDQAPVRDIIIENGFIKGVEYNDIAKNEKIKLRAKIIADCSGTFGAIRQKLPVNFSLGIHNRIPDHHLAASYREIVDLNEAHEFDNEIVLGYSPLIPPPGYLWFFSKGDKKLNIGTGWLKSENYTFDKSMKQIFREALNETYEEGEDYNIKIRGGGQIPIRPPFDSLVFNGGLLIGDSGCLVDPTTAEGHGIALVAGMYAAKAIDSAIKNNDFSIKSLWQYNIDVMNHYGRRNAISYVTLQFLREVEAKGMDKIIQKKLLTEIELKEVLNGENPSMSLKELLSKVIRGFPNFKLLYQLYKLTKNVTIMGNIYDNYPKSPEQLPSWISQRNIALNEKL